MQETIGVFSLREWHNQCPENLPALKKLLSNLDENSPTLKSLLDNLILVLICCKESQKNPTSTQRTFLEKTLKESLKLAGIITNTDKITYEELLKIRAQRRIAPEYLPKHLPDEPEPPYLSPELYTYLESSAPSNEKFLETRAKKLKETDKYISEFNPQKRAEERANKTQKSVSELSPLYTSVAEKLKKMKSSSDPVENDNQIFERMHSIAEKMEENLQRSYRRKRLARLNPFPRTHKVIKHGEIVYVPVKPKVENFLRLKKSYFAKEGLSKTVKSLDELKLPKKNDLLPTLDKFQHCFGSIITLDIDSQLKIELGVALNVLLDDYRDFFNSQLQESEWEKFSSEAQILNPPKWIDVVFRHLMEIIREYEKKSKTRFTSLTKSLAQAQGLPPMLLYQFYRFKSDYPDHFKPSNEHLNLPYLNEVEREQYRLHIVNGKFYRFEKDKDTGELKIQSFSSENFYSHQKTHWVSYIMNCQGEIYAHNHYSSLEQNGLLHSSFMSGGPVMAAGEFKIVNGVLTDVSNYSGHYGPGKENLKVLAQQLEKRGVDVSKVNFHAVEKQIVNAKLEKLYRSSQEKNINGSKRSAEEDKIRTDSERLEYSTQYRFKNGELVKTLTKKQILALALFLLIAAISLTVLIGLIVASHGVLIPVVTPLLAKAITFSSPALVYVLGALVSGISTLVSVSICAKISGVFETCKNKFNYLKNAFLGFGIKKECAALQSHPAQNPAKNTSFILSSTQGGSNHSTTPSPQSKLPANNAVAESTERPPKVVNSFAPDEGQVLPKPTNFQP